MRKAISSWLDSASGPALTIPAFMTMDGAYVADPAEQPGDVASWFGWLRLEGHGICALRRGEAHMATTVADWDVVDDRTVRLTLRPPTDGSKPPPFSSL
jgi:hypothetical protein